MNTPIVPIDTVHQALRQVRANNHELSDEEAQAQVSQALGLPVEVIKEADQRAA